MPVQSLDLVSLHESFATRLDPEELVDHCLDRLAALKDPGIFITIRDRAAILADYAALGPFDPCARPLWGLPFAAKDNIDVLGTPTTAACPVFAYMPAASAPAVELLQAAGAIFIGKTNLDQFATGLVGTRTPYPVPRNAIDPSLVPGGSSSGSAVAVAHGLVSFALGTDTAGSGRVPAALNNIVGLKPSLGLVSPRGVFPACRSLDSVSIFASSVDDAYKILELCARYDAIEPYSRPLPLRKPVRPPTPRIGIPAPASRRFFDDSFAEAAFDAALRNESLADAHFVEIDLELFFATAALLYEGPFVAERYQAIRDFIEEHPEHLYPVTREVVLGAQKFSAADAFAGLYRLAALRREAQSVWREIDLLALPTIPGIVTLAEIEADPLGPNARLGTYTNFVNLLDLCALAVPGPFRADGRPAGVTFIAPAGQDALLAAVGRVFHAKAGVTIGATPYHLPQIGDAQRPIPEASIEIAVVGAHLSGMPLNRDLVALGGEFVRKVITTRDYKFFALSGGPPRRPGLLRVAKGEGHAIETEVWALPPEGFGLFVSSIPAPLCIGTLHLADGTSPKGFLCEAEAFREAEDISEYGGWRAYLAGQEKLHG